MQPTTDPSQDPGRTTVSEARLLGVLDTAEDGIVVVDEAACILVFNRACERMFGYAAEEVVGRPLETIIPGGPAMEGDPEPRRALGPGREVRGLHRDGTLFPLDLSIGEAQTPEGRQFLRKLPADPVTHPCEAGRH